MRYLALGGCNVLQAYGVYAATFLLTRSYVAGLVLQHVAAVAFTFCAYRTWVFTGRRGSLLGQLLRFELVTGAGFLANLAVVPFLVHRGMQPLVAQALFVGCYACGSYLVHRRFTFGRADAAPSEA